MCFCLCKGKKEKGKGSGEGWDPWLFAEEQHVLQNSATIHQHLGLVDKGLSSKEILHRHIPDPTGLVPNGLENLMVELHILLQAILIHHIPQVLPDLPGVRVEMGPIGISGPGELIVDRGDITSTSRVPDTRSQQEEAGRLVGRQYYLFSSQVPPMSLFLS